MPVSARNASSRRFGAGLLLQLLRRALRHDLAVIDDGDALRHAVGLIHVVRGQKHRDAFGLVQVLHVRPQLIAALRIEAQRRLVQKQDLRRVQQPARDLQPPLHASGKLLHLVVAPVPQLEQLQQVLGALAA